MHSLELEAASFHGAAAPWRPPFAAAPAPLRRDERRTPGGGGAVEPGGFEFEAVHEGRLAVDRSGRARQQAGTPVEEGGAHRVAGGPQGAGW